MEKRIQYVAFGDSLTVGYGAEEGQGFVSVYRHRLECQLAVPVSLCHAGTNGATTAQLLETLESDLQLQKDIQEANLITITAGGNDLIQAAIPFFYDGDNSVLKTALQTYESNYRKIVHQIEQLRQGIQTPYLLVLIGLYNPIPQIPDAAYWIQRFNLFLRKLEQPHIQVVQVYDNFVDQAAQFLSEDAIHPNGLGYEQLANQLELVVTMQQLEKLIG
ncbi:GDSL-type esterase/lipase family protein [Paenibacillus roseipurpureus]|uniref:GDSL-type esterase/lipase family protein n=1 Tax=Paenibacillus roseopurpureus TaxID=2918901 RepID=A0AA96LJM7_9BACL|nr:GDSL-type esterase/lipase family protein [Paenibacillus sp. MBLB1832]WNR42203.1 GDSL-type esterase/lipase family protein [Paenibacillus sp. MBLB1832]